MTSTDNVYDKARAVLKERGWTQGILRDEETGGVCLVGALCEATGVGYAYELPSDIYPVVAKVVLEQWPDAESHIDGFADIPVWNDAFERTVEDIDLVLDKAARWLDEQVSP